jgi:polyketide synthase 12
MTGDLDQVDLSRIRRMGIAAMPTPEALALFDSARAINKPVLIPARVDVSVVRNKTAAELPLLLRGLVDGDRRLRNKASGTRDGDPLGLPARLVPLSDGEAQAAVLDWVRDQIAIVLGHPSSAAIDADQAFTQIGFDSLTSVELCNRLASSTGLRLPSTLVFNYPTPRELGGHIFGLLRPAAQTSSAEDAEIREMLRNVSIDRLRSAGILELVLACASPPQANADGQEPDAESGAGELAVMNLEALVDLALDEKGSRQ